MPAVAVGVAIVAAILGFFILKQFGDDGTKKTGTEAGAGGSAAATDPAVGATDADGNPIVVPDSAVQTSAAPVAPVAPARNTYSVVVANASKKQGAAKSLKTRMELDGFTALPPTNTLDNVVVPPITTTRVYFALTFEAAAQDVATYLGPGIIPEPLVEPSPVGPDFVGGQIVIAIGTDLAGKIPAGAQPQVQVGTDPAATAVTLAPVAGSPNETTTTVP